MARAFDQPASLIFDQAVQALATGDYALRNRASTRLSASSRDNVGAIGNLGIIYARTNRAAKAIAAYHRALRISPDDGPSC